MSAACARTSAIRKCSTPISKRPARIYAKLSKTPTEYEAFVNQIAEMWNTQPDYKKEELQAIKVPTVIADGQYDEGIKQEHTKEMAALISRRAAADPAEPEPLRDVAGPGNLQQGAGRLPRELNARHQPSLDFRKRKAD
jgi:hypothetical protein